MKFTSRDEDIEDLKVGCVLSLPPEIQFLAYIMKNSVFLAFSAVFIILEFLPISPALQKPLIPPETYV